MGETKLMYVVDDDEIFHFIIKKLLGQQSGYQHTLDITSFHSAEDALEQLRIPGAPLPALILLDVNMHSMSGWEFIEAFRPLRPTLPQEIRIIMCSSSMDVRDMQQVAATPELSAYLTKPLDQSKVKVILDALG
ncbi:response regulator [Chitinophaga japonensis]|uniref:CheY-like chemotaxis protein n=1 Tax=Chitinophaga japonensis TaxID=104662 RepID=A0A562SLH2_CHIJA|nr:response regulator [Chitinophaga japonensis]TWI82072.1 CheY-like chemotaxis protein [Chitinophaga japonensis]